MITQTSDKNEFAVTPEMAKEGFWLTVGNGSIYIRHNDDGIAVDIYPLNKEDGEAAVSCWVLDEELI